MCNIDENNNLEVGSEQLQFRFDIVEDGTWKTE